MRLFIDTEFVNDGFNVSPISIGMVRDGAPQEHFYAEVKDFDKKLANDWVKTNVLTKLKGEPLRTVPQLRQDVLDFIGTGKVDRPEFYAWYGAHDYVLFAGLFGSFEAYPPFWPQLFRDLRWAWEMVGGPPLPVQNPETAHNALQDALWLREVYHVLAPLWKAKTGGDL